VYYIHIYQQTCQTLPTLLTQQHTGRVLRLNYCYSTLTFLYLSGYYMHNI